MPAELPLAELADLERRAMMGMHIAVMCHNCAKDAAENSAELRLPNDAVLTNEQARRLSIMVLMALQSLKIRAPRVRVWAKRHE